MFQKLLPIRYRKQWGRVEGEGGLFKSIYFIYLFVFWVRGWYCIVGGHSPFPVESRPNFKTLPLRSVFSGYVYKSLHIKINFYVFKSNMMNNMEKM